MKNLYPLRRSIRIAAFRYDDLFEDCIEYIITDEITGLCSKIEARHAAVALALKSLCGDLTIDRIIAYAKVLISKSLTQQEVESSVQYFMDLGFLENVIDPETIKKSQYSFRKGKFDSQRVHQINDLLKRLKRVPYYKQRNDLPESISKLEEFSKIPTMTKDPVKQNLKFMQPMEYLEAPQEFPVSWGMSSGTTGDRVAVVSLERDVWENFSAGPSFVLGRGALSNAPRVAVLQTPICSGTDCHMDMSKTFEERSQKEPGDGGGRPTRGGVLMLNSYLSPTVAESGKFDENLSDMKKFGAEVLYGNSSYVASLAIYMLKKGTAAPKLRWIGLSGETSSRFHRKLISQAFQCPVYDIYGATDVASVVAMECEKGFMHPVPGMLVELVTATGTAKVGEVGRIVVTTLNKTLTPLLRYETGDLALASDPCSCSISYTGSFKRVEGRQKDLIETVSKEKVTPSDLDQKVFAQSWASSIGYYSLVQKGPSDYQFQYVMNPLDSGVLDEESVKKFLQSLLGTSANVRLAKKKEIFPSSTGKFRLCYQEFNESLAAQIK